MELLLEVIVYLLAAIIAVPVSKRLGFGSVLGYLAAGIVIGPFAFRLVDGTLKQFGVWVVEIELLADGDHIEKWQYSSAI